MKQKTKTDMKFGTWGILNGKKTLVVTHHYSIKEARLNAKRLGFVEEKNRRMRMNCGGSHKEGFYLLINNYYIESKNTQIYA